MNITDQVGRMMAKQGDDEQPATETQMVHGTAPNPFMPPGVDPMTYTRESMEVLKKAGYLCVYSRSDPKIPNVPLLRATNPFGSLLLESGMLSLFARLADALGPAAEGLMGLMPIEMTGVQVHEELHRFEIQGQVPSQGQGVRAANSVGEHIASVTMRWLIAPDDFEPAPGRVPPPTAIDMTRSQRFVMVDGRMTFLDGAQSGLRGFGSGRTFPTVVKGVPQLRIAAIVDVVETFGRLKNLPGTIVVNGYVQPPKGLFINFVARFIDVDGQLHAQSPLGPIQPIPDPDPKTTFLAFIGEPDPSQPARPQLGPEGQLLGVRVFEQLRLVQTGFDLGGHENLRSAVSEGVVVGGLAVTQHLDPMDRRPVFPFSSSDGVFTFTDSGGRTIGTLRADIVEGKVFRGEVAGRALSRFAGFGPILGGTGVFEGAIGMVTVNAGVEIMVGLSNLYILRISDPDGRFRAASQGASGTIEVGYGARPDAPSRPSGVDGTGAADITAEDAAILAHVEQTITNGIQLKTWLEAKDESGDYAEGFEIARPSNQRDRSVGFFDVAPINGSSVPVMGLVQEMRWDRPKATSAAQIRDEFREFSLRYFMRLDHFDQSTGSNGHSQPTPYLSGLSWYPEDGRADVGFGYRQIYYKRRDSGRIGKFSEPEQRAIADLRAIGDTYEWIVAKIRIVHADITMAPLGGDSLKVLYPRSEEAYVVLAPAFIQHHDEREGPVLGTYGFGYGFLPSAPLSDPVMYGPGHFQNAFQMFDFKVLADGEIRARAALVMHRPERFMSVNVDPIDWGLRLADAVTLNMASGVFRPMKDLAARLPLRLTGIDPIGGYISVANLVTGGMAGQQLGISMSVLEKRMLAQHFKRHYDTLVNALLVWRMFNAWCEPESHASAGTVQRRADSHPHA